MGDTFVITGLRDKRAELHGLIIDMEAKLRQARIDLGHIDAALLIFEPGTEPEHIRPLLPVRAGWFEKGEMSGSIRKVGHGMGARWTLPAENQG